MLVNIVFEKSPWRKSIKYVFMYGYHNERFRVRLQCCTSAANSNFQDCWTVML